VVSLTGQLEVHARTRATQIHGFNAERSAILADAAAFRRFATVPEQE